MRWLAGKASIRTAALSALVIVQCPWVAAAQAAILEELRTAEQIRQLTPEEASRHYPVRLRGVITFYDPGQFYRFIQDDSAGIYFDVSTNAPPPPPLFAGQLVEIEGETRPGEYAPIVMASRIQVLGQGTLPSAKPVSYVQLASGQQDSQFVEVHGIVRSVQSDEQTRYFSVEFLTDGGQLTALATKLPMERSEDLVDSTVRIRGVCTTHFNRQRQLFDIRLLVQHPSELVIEVPAPADPFAIPAQPIEKLLQFAPRGPYGHRVKVIGTVIYPLKGVDLYIEDETEGLQVETAQTDPLMPGDHIEVLGFPAKGEYIPTLQNAVFRKIGTGEVPQPSRVTADEALQGTYDCRLVRIEATVLDRARHSREQFLVLQSGGFIFHAYLERKGGGTDFAYLQNDSKVAITGVCLIERGKDWRPADAWRAKSFRILLRSANDIVLLQRPPWWNLQKLLWAVASLVILVLTAFAWVAILGHRVQKQTEIIREKLRTEAALKERYEDLFENANEMVFTCDPTGRITTINKKGEQSLQRSRQEILSRNLVDLVIEEERDEARHWLGQVFEDANSPPAEWNFNVGSGRCVRLEIGTRIVQRDGKQVEIEGIARDITEQTRLQKEILEISNREQRRLGHDLHDGVCQQLAGIAYRADTLADQLQGRGIPESADAEWIETSLQDAINQARGIAQGLFPVRLEESGLVLALQNLATNTRNVFDTTCELCSGKVLPKLENGVALHLYYIVQEAVLNAAKHGKASHIKISLDENPAGRLVLAIEDNGCGFRTPAVNDTGMGIRIMRYRARIIGATLDLKSQPQHGTQVTCAYYLTARVPPESTDK